MAVEVPGTLVGAGRNADVYDIGGGRVLRRYRDGRETRRVEGEARVMAHARSFGVPVPEVFDVAGADIVMQRAVGPTMLEFFGRRPWTYRGLAGLLARLHGLVHRVPAAGLDLPVPSGVTAAETDVLLHRDLHPMNVSLPAAGPMIIDWEGAARGPAIADVAMTWVIVGFSDVPGPRLEAFVARSVQAAFTRAFVREAGPLDESWRQIAIRNRLTDPNVLPTEAARMRKRAHAAGPSAASA
jgi:aminoglycoside phosphotransferase (APT) family kinase protein